MNGLMDTLQRQHQEKLERLNEGALDEAFLGEIHALITTLQEAGAIVAGPTERGQLRALMRFWGNVVYDHTGVYPNTMLHPLDPARASRPEEKVPSRHPMPRLVWMLVGGAAAVVIALGLVAIGWMGRFPDSAEEAPTPTPTETPLPFVSYAALGTEQTENVTLSAASTDIFCSGTSEISAQFALEGAEPETRWHWELKRADETVTASSPNPWGQEPQQTIRVLTGGPEGVEPGQYQTLIYVGEEVIGAQSFHVLDSPPRVSNLQITDVPKRPPEGPDSPNENTFAPGARVVYLNYDYEGFCPGLEVTAAIYYKGESIQDSAESWDGVPQGRGQINLQAPGSLPFSPGSYEAAVLVAGEEQARVEFTIGQSEPEAPEEVPPAFGDITVALGAQPNGTPILNVPENRFDWNTKAVYAIFDYQGMTDGLAWSAVWMRSGQEVKRQEKFWDVAVAGTEGTHWAVHYGEAGQLLPGGTYSVTLYIKNIAQRTADFSILYYVPVE